MDEELNVAAWPDKPDRQLRFAQAQRLGLDATQARLFAESSVPLWKLRTLIERDCPPRTAFRILA